MRKAFSFLSLAAATILLLGSCAKINERIDSLESRIDGLEREDIATIGSQIESINSSIADLGTIRTNIQNLTSTTAAQAQDIKDLNNEDTEIGKKISDLKKADESINTRIDNLQKYVNDTLKAYATTEWVNATFSTLAQYEATCDTIAKIDARIGSMDTRLSKSIEDCADSLKSWVNVQLDGYYTIAQMDAKVAQMNAQIDTLSSTSAATADSLKAEIAATKAEIDTVKANIRTEYKAAIETAITELDGKLSNELQTKILQVNSSISALSGRVTTLESSLATLTGRVDALEAMIQSVVIVPAYSDGSVKVENDSLYIDCIVSPDTVVNKLTKENISILINKVKTKAFAGVDTVKISNGDIFKTDASNGSISIRVKISDKLPASPDSTITVAVNVKNGKSDYTTKFAPVYVAPAPVAPEGFVYLGVKDANGKPLYWAEKNLGASNPEDYGKYYSWGDVTGQTPSESTFSTAFKWDNDVFGQYFNKVAQTTACPNGILTPAYDAATAANSSWRTPTTDEFVALAANCVLIWCDGENEKYNNTTVKGYIVYKAKSEEDKGKANMNGTWKKWNGSSYDDDSATTESYSISDTHIFFPAAGYGQNSILCLVGSSGYYWSSSLYNTDFPDFAYNLRFESSSVNPQAFIDRCYGFSVRPVTTGSAAPTPTTTGTAKRTGDIDVNWVQLWAGGPKFAEYNVGASSATDVGSTMTFTDATKTGAEYVWGANWCTPSKEDMEHLMTAAKGQTDEKVKCEFTQEGGKRGFKFTGKETGYNGNSVFFPAQDGNDYNGFADYWSASANGSEAWDMSLSYYGGGNWSSVWLSLGQGYGCLVRPVLKN